MLDLTKYKHVHCVGIGGVGLSAVAEVLLSKGYTISGSDMKENEHTDRLKADGAHIYIGHSAEQVDGADLVVYSAAVSHENPELAAAAARGIPIASRAEVLGLLMRGHAKSIAIAGTHGKTTTTSMVSLILEHSHLSPTILIGGSLSEFGGNVKVGSGDYFVTEACEYMDNFLSLAPRIEIILNIDSDHLDYFKDIDHIVRSFEKFAALVPNDGTVIAYSANPFVNTIIKDLPCNVITFGFNEKCDYYAKNIIFNTLGMPSFDLCADGAVLRHLQLSVPGEHNIANALAAAACCHTMGVELSTIAETLEAFTGTDRRFDVIGTTKSGVCVVDDYAHHPTEIRATLKASGNIPHNKIWCLFQPHTYTRTLALFDQFADAFNDADKVILTDIYAAREKNIYKVSSKELAAEIKRTHPSKEVYYIAGFNEIASFVTDNAEKGDLVITMGAGDIYKVAELLMDKDK